MSINNALGANDEQRPEQPAAETNRRNPIRVIVDLAQVFDI